MTRVNGRFVNINIGLDYSHIIHNMTEIQCQIIKETAFLPSVLSVLKAMTMTAHRHMTSLRFWTFFFFASILASAHSVHGVEEWPDCFRDRCTSLYDYCATSLAKATGNSSPYIDLAVLAKGEAIEGTGIKFAIEKMNNRKDCADFDLPAMLWLLYRYQNSPLVDVALMHQVRQCILGFKYWFDGPGNDSMCMWTENHQICFTVGAYLAGQLYPQEVFTNSGLTGTEMMEINKARILRWLDLRFRTGFSEWLSNIYYNIDIPPLLCLIDLSKDRELTIRAAMVTDLLLLDISLNCYCGNFASTHGRTNEQKIIDPKTESTHDAQWLLFGMGDINNLNNSGIALALSDKYLMPQVIYEIANDTQRPEFINRQRMGINVSEGDRWNVGYEDIEDGAVWLAMEAYTHPATSNLFVRMLDAYNWWNNDYFKNFRKHRTLIKSLRTTGMLSSFVAQYEQDLARNTREEVNIYSYRTPDFMLSSIQNYKPGYGGDQAQVWEATLGGKAVCFTTHPAKYNGSTPNYWTGDGWLPDVVQYKNVVFILYDSQDKPGLYVQSTLGFTHAWLDQDQFDETTERSGWIFARSGNGYLALHSQNPYVWSNGEGSISRSEIIVSVRQNVWICELGRAETNGSFVEFINNISKAKMEFNKCNVRYMSPSQGSISYSYGSGLLYHNDAEIIAKDYPRYENQYVVAEFPASIVNVFCNSHKLLLNWHEGKRDSGLEKSIK